LSEQLWPRSRKLGALYWQILLTKGPALGLTKRKVKMGRRKVGTRNGRRRRPKRRGIKNSKSRVNWIQRDSNKIMRDCNKLMKAKGILTRAAPRRKR
jgi:hypothetical protein